MKKIVKILTIILINLVLVLDLFFITDYIYKRCEYNRQCSLAKKEMDQTFFLKKIYSNFKYNSKVSHFKNFSMHKEVYSKDNKSSILVFGGSFAYGAFIDANQNLSANLSKLSGRTVYNRAIPTFGFGQMLYQTMHEDLYNDIKIPAEYAIYVYIPDHFIRSCHYKYGVSNLNGNNYYLSYELQDGKLIEKNPPFLFLNKFAMFYSNTKKNFCSKNNYDMGNEKNFDFVKQHFVQAREELLKRYPHLKFIILKYPYNYVPSENLPKEDEEYYNMSVYENKRWKELQDEGFIIIEADEKTMGININSDDYRLPDGHPNEKAWNVITPKLIKILNL